MFEISPHNNEAPSSAALRYTAVLGRLKAIAAHAPCQAALLPVSKGHSSHAVVEFMRLGLTNFAENYAQEFIRKQEDLILNLPNDLLAPSWHFIGRLQSNKIKEIWQKVHLVHSFDRLNLLHTTESHYLRQQAQIQKLAPLPILIQIQIDAHDVTKGGVPYGPLLQELCTQVSLSPSVILCGFMGIGPQTSDLNDLKDPYQKFYETVQNLWKQWGAQSEKKFHDLLPSEALSHLQALCPLFPKQPIVSLGMSHDLEAACQWGGSNLVRIGTALFGPRTGASKRRAEYSGGH